jgi:hypothetical protein
MFLNNKKYNPIMKREEDLELLKQFESLSTKKQIQLLRDATQYIYNYHFKSYKIAFGEL